MYIQFKLITPTLVFNAEWFDKASTVNGKPAISLSKNPNATF